MSCHVYALSGDSQSIADSSNRYAKLGDYLLGTTTLPVQADTVPPNLNTVTNTQITDCLAEIANAAGDQQIAILGLLCAEFGLALQPGSGIRLWGHTEPGQMLPEHMYVTYTDNRIYDTMPNTPVRRNDNVNGTNPPSYGEGNVLQPNVIFSIEVAALAPGTMAAINSATANWADGM
ncbi:MAG TPA: hypothetical protein VF676_11120 [Flavobacterium sp.]